MWAWLTRTGDPRCDLPAITAVHPMRESEVRSPPERDHADWQLAGTLLAAGELNAIDYEEEPYLLAVQHAATRRVSSLGCGSCAEVWKTYSPNQDSRGADGLTRGGLP
jgi:hypothetical protein